ncbi:MAG TPA: hypothetical protein DCQ28_01675 [Bacteroidetes bacterium]|nr:hypothetical protein [Bacteroidota bacterium]
MEDVMKKMLRIALLVPLSALLSTAIWAQVTLPYYEPFNYTDATNLGGQAGWVNLNTGDEVIVTAGNLSYTGYTPSFGNRIKFDGAGLDPTMTFTQTNSGKIYCSYLLNVTSLGSLNATGGYYSVIYQSPSSITGGCLQYTRLDGTEFDIGLGARVGTTVSWSSAKSLNTTYLIVVSYEIVPGDTNDVVNMWINPDVSTFGGTEPAPTLTATNTLTDLTGLSRFNIRQNSTTGTPFIEIDELRIATTWADVTVPVELVSFTALARSGKVELHWSTATEVNNAGFAVEKNIGGVWNGIGFVEGNGTTNAPKDYSFTDISSAGKYQYRLQQIDRDGKFTYSNTVEAVVALTAEDYKLGQNFPNPFNPTTNITFVLKNSEHATVSVYNMLGQHVATLFNGEATAHQIYSLTFDAKNLPSGMYFYSLQSATRNEVKKMMLLK